MSQGLKRSDYFYTLPQDRIAQHPIEPRDASRLMVVDRAKPGVSHHIFRELPDFLRPGDVLVVNDTRVLPARLLGERPTGGHAEVLLLKRRDLDRWECLVKPGRRLRPGATVSFGGGELVAHIERELPDGGRIVRFAYEGVFEQVLERLGRMPLPPYIKEQLEDQQRYQTVYAQHAGSAAAPTAGLHFTPELMARIEGMGVPIVRVLLHVGLGTFRPVKEDDVTDHKMHSEYYEVSEQAAERVNAARRTGGRIISVGTTSCRVLETASDADHVLHAGRGWTDIFIYPGYAFKQVDALITNFHLPESTLLMLVSALAGRERMLAAYETAVQEGYRFFSFGDAMLIL
jgi:S-adenosylmethionine:tRNA ribosyltransferase-isomerase